jgi:hypothetical protein
MTHSIRDLPTGRQIEEAWRGVESVLRSRRRDPDRRFAPLVTEEPRCSPR